jgi:uncharacterized phiE125 gp8 family phage protein
MLRNRTKDVKTVTDVSTEPVTLQEVKDFLKVGFVDDDTIITGMISAARQLLEKQLNISIAPKTLKVAFTHDGCYEYQLPYGPVADVTEAKFKYDAEDTAEIMTTSYTLIGDDFKQFLGRAGWWTLTYAAGYSAAPDAIKQGVLKQVAWMYENRGDGIGSNQVNQDVLFMLSGFNKNAWI